MRRLVESCHALAHRPDLEIVAVVEPRRLGCEGRQVCIHSYGLYSYGLYSYAYGLYSCGLESYGLYSNGL